MKKNLLIALVTITLAACNQTQTSTKPTPTPKPTTKPTPILQPGNDPLNTTYLVEGIPITLIDGKSEIEVSAGSANKTIITVWGQTDEGDLNGDGQVDSSIILIKQTPGLDSFYYVAAALQNQDETVTGTNAVLIGDQVIIQNQATNNGIIKVNYTSHPERVLMEEQPSQAITGRYAITEGTTLEDITQAMN